MKRERERELKTKLACRSLGKGRKKWIIPQLIVLVRGESGEGVLVSCKYDSPYNAVWGPAEWNQQCVCSKTEFGATICIQNRDNLFGEIGVRNLTEY